MRHCTREARRKNLFLSPRPCSNCRPKGRPTSPAPQTPRLWELTRFPLPPLESGACRQTRHRQQEKHQIPGQGLLTLRIFEGLTLRCFEVWRGKSFSSCYYAYNHHNIVQQRDLQKKLFCGEKIKVVGIPVTKLEGQSCSARKIGRRKQRNGY